MKEKLKDVRDNEKHEEERVPLSFLFFILLSKYYCAKEMLAEKY